MQNKSQSVFAKIGAFFAGIWAGIKRIFLKIFPKRAAKYFDADRHELKYILIMAVTALLINFYMEWFARFTTSPLEGFRWALSNPLVFLYNALIIFATMTIALIFKRQLRREALLIEFLTKSRRRRFKIAEREEERRERHDDGARKTSDRMTNAQTGKRDDRTRENPTALRFDARGADLFDFVALRLRSVFRHNHSSLSARPVS